MRAIRPSRCCCFCVFHKWLPRSRPLGASDSQETLLLEQGLPAFPAIVAVFFVNIGPISGFLRSPPFRACIRNAQDADSRNRRCRRCEGRSKRAGRMPALQRKRPTASCAQAKPPTASPVSSDLPTRLNYAFRFRSS
jgi:hypothetical protein